MTRRPAPGQDAKVERFKAAAAAALVARGPEERTAAWREFQAARQDINWEEA